MSDTVETSEIVSDVALLIEDITAQVGELSASTSDKPETSVSTSDRPEMSVSRSDQPETSTAPVSSPLETRVKECAGCNVSCNPDMINCRECKEWWHFECAELTYDQAHRISRYVCDDCTVENSIITVWKVLMPNYRQREDKRKNYYEVENIVGNRVYYRARRIRMFKIKWLNYSKESWEPEHNLDGCLNLLQAYLRSNGLPLSNIQGLYGASSSNPKTKFEKKNWASLETIIESYAYLKRYYFPKVQFYHGEWENFDQDGIYFIGYERHCYVVLYLKAKNIGFIGDGTNEFMTHYDTAMGIHTLLGIRLTACEFKQQVKVDHCASSAVLIALEMTRAYQSGSYPDILTSPKSWRDRVTKTMHKYKSAPMELLPLRKRRQSLVCEHCKRTFKCTARKQLFQHIKFCKPQ